MTAATDPFSLEGKRILVTGASSGLGRAIAIGAATVGAEVVLTGRDATRLEETCSTMAGTGHRCVSADLTDAGQRDALVKETGTVHGVVHCAGIAAVRLLRQVDQAFIDRDFGINFHAPVLLTQRLLASRQIAHGGSVVFIGSIAAHIGTLASSIYSASKAALRPAGRSLALEVGPKQKIRVNYVAVSYVETPMLARLAQQGMGSSLDAHTEPPLGKGTPEDVAHSAIFLLADASRWITRATLYVDGGLTCQISAQ